MTKLGTVWELRLSHQSQVAFETGPLHHGEVVDGRLLEAGENASALFEPTDEPLDDVAIAVSLTVELNGPRVAVLVDLRGDHRLDAVLQEPPVDPVGAVRLILRQPRRASQVFAVVILPIDPF